MKSECIFIHKLDILGLCKPINWKGTQPIPSEWLFMDSVYIQRLVGTTKIQRTQPQWTEQIYNCSLDVWWTAIQRLQAYSATRNRVNHIVLGCNEPSTVYSHHKSVMFVFMYFFFIWMIRVSNTTNLWEPTRLPKWCFQQIFVIVCSGLSYIITSKKKKVCGE